METGTITFKSSIQKLNQGFEWAKAQALSYVREDENGAGKWYEAALPGSFEVIVAYYEQYLWTGDTDYLKNPVFTKYYSQTCEEQIL